MKNENIVFAIISDTHSEGNTGLTLEPKNEIQELVLENFLDAVDWFGEPPTYFLHVGDGYDGKDPKSGDISEGCLLKQAEMCALLIEKLKPKRGGYLVSGTDYHVNIGDQSFEGHIKKCLQYEALKNRGVDLKVDLSSLTKISGINGWFNLQARHFIGGSGIPHGRATAPLREQMWSTLHEAEMAVVDGKTPRLPHLMVYGHRHDFLFVKNSRGSVLVCPSWQAMGSLHGDKKCTGHVDLGIIKLTITPEEGTWCLEEKLYPAEVADRWSPLI